MKKSARRRIDVNLDELDRVLDGARQAPYWRKRKSRVKLRLNRISARHRRPDTGAMEPRPSVAHDRLRSRIRA